MFKVAKIKQNKLEYRGDDLNLSRFTLDKIEEDIEDYIEFVKVTHDDMLVTVGKILNMQPGYVGDTTTCASDDKYIYQICHLTDNANTEKKQNNIAIKLIHSSHCVVGDAVLFKTSLSNGKSEFCDITMDDICKLYQDIFIKTCVKIKVDGTVSEIKYVVYPIEWMNDLSNVRYYHSVYLDKLLMFYIEVNPTKNVLNEKASLLYGKAIFGDVIIAFAQKPKNYFQEDDFVSVVESEINKLVAIHSINDEKLSSDESQITNLCNYNIVLNKHFSIYKNKHSEDYKKDKLKTFDLANNLNVLTQKKLAENISNNTTDTSLTLSKTSSTISSSVSSILSSDLQSSSKTM